MLVFLAYKGWVLCMKENGLRRQVAVKRAGPQACGQALSVCCFLLDCSQLDITAVMEDHHTVYDNNKMAAASCLVVLYKLHAASLRLSGGNGGV